MTGPQEFIERADSAETLPPLERHAIIASILEAAIAELCGHWSSEMARRLGTALFIASEGARGGDWGYR